MENIIFIFILFFLFYIFRFNLEYFDSNYYKNPYIWMYWENKGNSKKAAYLELCFQTVEFHCNKDFNIELLNQDTIFNFLPNISPRLLESLSIPQKTDYYRYQLLNQYGGIWLDSDTIVFKSLLPIIEKLKTHDFVGFGCHNEIQCIQNPNGYGRPANWVMGSRKGGLMIRTLCKFVDHRLKHRNQYESYHFIGRNLIWNVIETLEKKRNWTYYHYPSKCLERDSKGYKLTNQRMLSKEHIDSKCLDKLLFVPIYNSAPGFPDWFLKMNLNELLSSGMLISKYFRLALKY